MTKRKQPDDVILIEEEPENQSVPPPSSERVAVRIVSKEKVNQNGASRFLVKWKNQNEETWETEDFLRSKYPDLVDDYEYHRLTDQRLKDKGPSNSRKAVKQATKSNHDTQQVTSKSKRSIQALKQMSQQQQQQCGKMMATPEDKVEKVSLVGGLFKVEWRKRPDGDTPFSDHYSYEQLSQICSLICMKFIEAIVFERSDRTFPVQFYCEGETYNDRYQAVQYAIHGRKVTDPQVENTATQFQVQISLDEALPVETELVQATQNDTTQEQPQDQQLQLVIEVSVPNSPNNEPQREQSHAPEVQHVEPVQQVQSVQAVQPEPTPIRLELPEVPEVTPQVEVQEVQVQEVQVQDQPYAQTQPQTQSQTQIQTAEPVETEIAAPINMETPLDVEVPPSAVEVPPQQIVEPVQVISDAIEIEDAPQEQAPTPQEQQQVIDQDIVPSLCAPEESQQQMNDVPLSQGVPAPDLESLPDRPSAEQVQQSDAVVITSLMIEDAPINE